MYHVSDCVHVQRLCDCVPCLCVCNCARCSSEGHQLTLSPLCGVVSSLFSETFRCTTRRIWKMMYLQWVVFFFLLPACVWDCVCAERGEREGQEGWGGGGRERMREGWRGVEGKTNYRPDNRQAMDFLPGFSYSSSIPFLSLSLSIFVALSL